MSELKIYHHELRHNEYEEFYLKYEADKVIAELKKERDWLAKDRAQAYDDLEKRAQLNIKQEESNRHQKYKRCLAMALVWFERAENSTDWENELVSRKRFSKWMELAEKFKEVK